MGTVAFSIEVPMRASATAAWSALIDWAGHGDWIPATRSRILDGTGDVGTVFEAISGFGPLALVDRMRVQELAPSERRAVVEKLGPVLRGTAGFTVSEQAAGCIVQWLEEVRVPFLPQVFAVLVAAVSRLAFRDALRRLDAHLR